MMIKYNKDKQVIEARGSRTNRFLWHQTVDVALKNSNDDIKMGLNRKTLRKELSKFTKKFLVYMIFTVLDMVLGSLLFYYIEHCYDVVPPDYKPMENSYLELCQLLKSTRLLVDKGPDNVTNATTNNYKRMKEICDSKWMYIENIECELNRRTFSKWFEYTASIGFTVGYGHVVTRSATGRIVTMVYIIPTIAFTMVMYIHAANVIITIAKITIFEFETRVLKRSKVQYPTAKVFGLQLLVTIILVVVSALFYTFNNVHEMTFIDSLYFTITSLTTIGFGDFTLDFRKYLQETHLFLILCLLWFFGMGMVASIIAGLSEMVSKYKFGNLSKILRLKCCEYKVDGETSKSGDSPNIEIQVEQYRKTTITNIYTRDEDTITLR